MDKTLHSELTALPELTLEEVLNWMQRVITETMEVKANAYGLLARSHGLLEQADEILAKR